MSGRRWDPEVDRQPCCDGPPICACPAMRAHLPSWINVRDVMLKTRWSLWRHWFTKVAQVREWIDNPLFAPVHASQRAELAVALPNMRAAGRQLGRTIAQSASMWRESEPERERAEAKRRELHERIQSLSRH